MADAPALPRTRPMPASEPHRASGQRLEWLDALRGIAALCVVFDHLGTYVLQHARHVVSLWFDPGQYGVYVFFLVSGFIVPASLERKGSVRSFWVGRAFRLYPLYLFALVAVVVPWRLGMDSLRGAGQHPGTSALGHMLMLSNLLGVPNAINVIWTLSYEMAFYLLLTALFVMRVHQRSAGFALGFAVAAVAIGGVLPMTALSHSFLGARLVALVSGLLIVGGVALAAARHRVQKVVGALLAATTAMALVAFNGSWVNPWRALTILALMFTGTMVYRAERGEFGARRAAVLAVAVFALVIAAGLWHVHAWHMGPRKLMVWDREWITSLGLAGLTFAVGLACRHKKVPSPLAWLGLVSYSVYLLHPLLIRVYKAIPGTGGTHPLLVQILLAAAFVTVLLGCCALAYRLIEDPMQRQGKKLAAWLEARLGPDRIPDAGGPGRGRASGLIPGPGLGSPARGSDSGKVPASSVLHGVAAGAGGRRGRPGVERARWGGVPGRSR